MFIRTEFQAEEDIADILEETFDTCSSNREEIYWLITVLRCFLNVRNRCTEPVKDNYALNMWQSQMFPIVERYKKKYKCSTR